MNRSLAAYRSPSCLALLAVVIGALPTSADPARASASPPAEEQTAPVPPGAMSSEAEQARDTEAEVPAEAAGEVLQVAEEKPWLDRMRDGFHESVDGTARWFDGFFGEEVYDDTTTRTYGRAKLVVAYKEYEGVILRGEFRGRFPLPNLDKRLNAIIGRGDPTSIIEDDEAFGSLLPDDDDDQWLAGLGYTPPWSSSGRISLSAGVHIDWPPEPYVQARYRMVHRFSKKSLMRFRETVFWQSTDGFGATTNIDLERKVSDDRLLRWSNLLKVSEVIDDLRYDSRLTLYQKLGRDRAMSWTVGVKGETGDPAPVREYGTIVTYRQRMFREWFFGEFLGGVTWLRETDWDERKFGVVFGIGFEIQFGEPPAATTAPNPNPGP